MDKTKRNVLISFSSILIIFCTFFYVTLSDALPYNAFSSVFNSEKSIFKIFPQGWAFFTRSPREAQAKLYEIDGDKIKEIKHYHSSYHYLLGASKENSRYVTELAYLFNKIPQERYTDAKSNIQLNNIDKIPTDTIQITNPFDNPRIIGTYILIMQELVPWAWTKNIEREMMDCKTIKMVVSCTK